MCHAVVTNLFISLVRTTNFRNTVLANWRLASPCPPPLHCTPEEWGDRYSGGSSASDQESGEGGRQLVRSEYTRRKYVRNVVLSAGTVQVPHVADLLNDLNHLDRHSADARNTREFSLFFLLATCTLMYFIRVLFRKKKGERKMGPFLFEREHALDQYVRKLEKKKEKKRKEKA